jgi:hypothetical protein
MQANQIKLAGKQMTNNNIWDCADLAPMFSEKWSIDDSASFVFLVCKCIFVIHTLLFSD